MYKKKEWKKRVLSVGLAAIMTLSGQVAVFAEESQPFTAKDGVIDEQEGDVYYEIFVRAFRDSNGDHIGDLRDRRADTVSGRFRNYRNLADADY